MDNIFDGQYLDQSWYDFEYSTYAPDLEDPTLPSIVNYFVDHSAPAVGTQATVFSQSSQVDPTYGDDKSTAVCTDQAHQHQAPDVQDLDVHIEEISEPKEIKALYE